jgi:hypothetical protein
MHKQEPDKDHEHPDPLFIQKTIHQLLEQISIRDQKVLWLNSEKRAALRSFQEREQGLLRTISEKDAVLQYTQNQLTARESQLNEILNSRSWKIALFVQRLRVFIAPPKGRPAQPLQGGLGNTSSSKKPGKD